MILTASIFLSTVVYAHHAKEFIVIESYDQALKNSAILLNQWDDAFVDRHDSAEDEWEYTPTLLYGITDRIQFDLHGHLKKVHGTGAFVEAGTAGFQFQLTKPEERFVNVGFSIEYELPTNRSRHTIDGSDTLYETLIISKEFPRETKVVANFGAEQHLAWGGKPEWIYGVGIKTRPFKRLDFLHAGIEWTGTFDGLTPEASLIPGIYLGLPFDFILKAGLQIGMTEDTDDLTMTFALVKTLF